MQADAKAELENEIATHRQEEKNHDAEDKAQAKADLEAKSETSVGDHSPPCMATCKLPQVAEPTCDDMTAIAEGCAASCPQELKTVLLEHGKCKTSEAVALLQANATTSKDPNESDANIHAQMVHDTKLSSRVCKDDQKKPLYRNHTYWQSNIVCGHKVWCGPRCGHYCSVHLPHPHCSWRGGRRRWWAVPWLSCWTEWRRHRTWCCNGWHYCCKNFPYLRTICLKTKPTTALISKPTTALISNAETTYEDGTEHHDNKHKDYELDEDKDVDDELDNEPKDKDEDNIDDKHTV